MIEELKSKSSMRIKMAKKTKRGENIFLALAVVEVNATFFHFF
jgi:hypothetical protein